MARDAQCILNELNNLFRSQVMNQQSATYDIEARVPKGKSNCISSYGGEVTVEVSGTAIDDRVVENSVLCAKTGDEFGRRISGCAADFENRKGVLLNVGEDSREQPLAGADAAKPSIDAAQVRE